MPATVRRTEPSRPLLDATIRDALVGRRLRRQLSQPQTLVIHELGLVHAKSRIDVATVNGVIHGFEIKGSQDSLARLPQQLDTYAQTLQRLTLVVASRHVERVHDLTLEWVGITEVHLGKRGAVGFHARRPSRRNPDVDTYLMAHLLWRDEVQAILTARGATKRELRAPRAELYRLLVQDVTEHQLIRLIKSAMMQRPAWRDHLRPS